MTPPLTPRLAEALSFAIAAHDGQVRKGTEVPYVAHLLGVAGLALEAGGDEDVAVAALLHDVVEDTDVTVEDVRAGFGDRVAGIVAACSDTNVTPKPPWEPRKAAYLDHMADPATPHDVLVVALADKLHNVRSIITEVRALGPAAWERFNRGAEAQLWYYGRLVDILTARLPGALTDEFCIAVQELRALAGDLPGGF
jgi:(p)ppGpp synthase/HD superfamily hydrolase